MLVLPGQADWTGRGEFPDRHIYAYWDHILEKKGYSEHDNPWTHPYYKGSVQYSKDMCPQSLDYLGRAVAMGIPDHLSDAEATGTWRPPPLDAPHGLLTFGAQFAEVAVDPQLGLVRVRRLVGTFAPGRVLNPLLARSQLMGGMLWGMSQALLEGNHMDPRYGRWAATNLAEYLVPVNADAPDVLVDFVQVQDDLVGPLGAKGVGEIGQVGVAAAIANAVFHATGRRPRELPLAPELVMDPPTPRG